MAPPPMMAPPPAGGSYVPVSAPSGGRASSNRLILIFVIILLVGLAAGAAAVVALQPGPVVPPCPPAPANCGAPPEAPTLPPIGRASPTANPTPLPTIVRPSGSLVIPSIAPSAQPTAAPTVAPSSTNVTPSATSGSTLPPTSTPAPSTGAVALPVPQAPTGAAPLQVGATWTSSKYNFTVEYDDGSWVIEDERDSGVVLSAGNGAVIVWIEGFDPGTSPKSVIQSQRNNLENRILGLTEEDDPERTPPGRPIIGHKFGESTLLNGTLNGPQGPSDNVSLAVIAATDDNLTLRVTVLAIEEVRDPAFSFADRLINAIHWPNEQ
jgi:hypothetical protein